QRRERQEHQQQIAQGKIGKRKDDRIGRRQQSKDKRAEASPREIAPVKSRRQQKNPEQHGDIQKFQRRDVRRKIRRRAPKPGKQKRIERRILGLRRRAGQAGDPIAPALSQRLGDHGVDAIVVKQSEGAALRAPERRPGQKQTEKNSDRPESPRDSRIGHGMIEWRENLAGLRQLLVDNRGKRLQRLRPGNLPAVDKKRGSAVQAEICPFVDISLYRSPVFPNFYALLERWEVQTHVFGCAVQIVAAQFR